MFTDYYGENYVDADGTVIRAMTRAERRAERFSRRTPLRNVERQNRSDARPASHERARRVRRTRRHVRAQRREGWSV